MKNLQKQIIFVLSLFLTTIVFSQTEEKNIYITYELSYQPQVQSAIRKDDFQLIVVDQIAFFQSLKKIRLDSVKRSDNYRSQSEDVKRSIRNNYFSNFSEIIKIEPISSTILFTKEILGNPTILAQYVENFKPIWKTNPEKKIINNVEFFKATTTAFGREWTAWYAPSYAVPFGPYKFYGLPGLIFSIQDATNSYSYVLTSITTKNNPINYNYATGAINMTKEKFLKMESAQNERVLNTVKNITKIDKGAERTITAGEFRKMREQQNRRLNPLELLIR